MIRTETSVRVLQAVAAIAGLAVLLWSVGLPSFHLAEAASLVSVSNTLSDSAPSALSDHAINFTIPTGSAGVEAGETLVVTFPTNFNLSTSTATTSDIDLEINGVDATLGFVASGATWGVSISGQNLTFTSGTGVISADDDVTVKVGGNAADGFATGTTKVSNPGVGTYEFNITSGTGGNNDSGSTLVAIIDNVDVTASVDTVFTFTVAGVGGGAAVNGTTTTGTTTATTIPFGTLRANQPTTTAQDLFVTTNASQGFVVTAHVDQTLLSSTGADIDGFNNGSYTDTPGAWAVPTATLGNDNTYGHWGLTTEDFVTGRASEFDTDEWIAASTTPRIIFGHTGPADGTSSGTGTARIGYQIEISALQEAGDDYSATLTYIATPTF